MRKTSLFAVAFMLTCSLAFAQTGDDGPRPKDVPPDRSKCPASGHAPPILAYGGSPYELAGPCTPQAVRDAAEAIGMGRNRPIGVKNIITFRYYANGVLADEAGRMDKISKLQAHISYVIPAMRMELEGVHADGSPLKEVRVFAESFAWNETAPGIGATPAPRDAAQQRAPLVKLTPVGALMSIVEAEGNAKVSKVRGKTTLSGASPYDNVPVTVTLDAKNRPETVVVLADQHRYEARFEAYTDETPPYMVVFPSHMIWTLDGKPLADLKVTEFRSNPYAIFPIPAVARGQ